MNPPPNKHILVVDDEPAARALLQRRLEKEGYEVSLAEDGQLALAAIARRRPDLVMLDMMMPHLGGVGVVEDLRGRPETADLPVIAVSAQGRSLERTFPPDARPDAYFPKPLDFHELLDTITSLVSGRSQPRDQGVKLTTVIPPPPKPRSQIVAIVGAKGGVGTTTVATNVAVCIARAREAAILVETATFHGTTATMLGLDPRQRMDRLPLAAPASLTGPSVADALVAHPSGLRVLLGPLGSQPPPPADSVITLLQALKSLGGTVVVDLDDAVTVFGQVALRVADRVIIVTAPEPASVERARALIRVLEQWGLRPDLIELLINQTTAEAALAASEIGERTGRQPAWSVPAAPEACFEAARRNLPLIETAPDHAATRALASLAATLAGLTGPVAMAAPRSVVGAIARAGGWG